MAITNLFDQTSNLLHANMNRRSVSNRLIARNLANIDTPNYTGTGLEFEKQLRTALSGGILPQPMKRTDPRHISIPEQDEPFGHAASVYKNTGAVHLDIEMSKLAENNIMFNAMIQLLNKKYTLLKTAIADGGNR
ncbi:MAG: flagellar basal body rod protein FlgB [Desulfarculales bacterium]|nr:flagellar basal body rod protein FlgB [Desulfarculales bacterium]